MDRATVSTGDRTFTWKRATGRHAKAGSLNGAVRAVLVPARELLDETGTPVLCGSGQNYSYSAGACITFPDQRWLKFPVRGTETENAIMTAVDQAGNKVARYRSLAIGGVLGSEITVHPRQQLTNELVLALVMSAPWLHSYFTSSGGGG